MAANGRDVEAARAYVDTGIKELDQTPRPVMELPKPFNIGNPAPLGLLGFGFTTIFLMFLDTSWLVGDERTWIAQVNTYAVFYGGVAQVLAGVFELLKNNSFAGTAFTSYGCFWLAFALNNFNFANHIFEKKYMIGQTLFLVAWGVLTSCFFLVTLRKCHALMFVFGSLAITFFLLAGGVWNHICLTVAGYVGFICGCSAIYTAIAELWHEHLGLPMPGLKAVKYL